MILRWLKVVLIVVLLAAAVMMLRARYQLGQFAALGPSTPSQVQAIRNEAGTPLVGAEDIAVDHVMRRAYLSVFDRHAGNAARGNLYMLPLDDPAFMARDVTATAPRTFRPHGVDLYRDAQGRASLYVINQTAMPTVEIFDISANGNVRYRETITDSSFIGLNAIAVVAPRQFYLTSDQSVRSALRRRLKALFNTKESSIVYFDGAIATTVVDGLNHSSGLAISRDGNELYVGEGYSWRVKVFRRHGASGSLILSRTIPLDAAPDNLKVDPGGGIWIGAHPQPYKVYAFASDPTRPSPSEVVSVDLSKPNAEAVKVVFRDAGTRVNSSATGVRFENLLLVSSIFGSPVVVFSGRE